MCSNVSLIMTKQKCYCTYSTYFYIDLDVDTCERDLCLNGGTCVQNPDMPNFRECNCAAGYTGVDCETGENRMHQTLPVFQSVQLSFRNHTKTECLNIS